MAMCHVRYKFASLMLRLLEQAYVHHSQRRSPPAGAGYSLPILDQGDQGKNLMPPSLILIRTVIPDIPQ